MRLQEILAKSPGFDGGPVDINLEYPSAIICPDESVCNEWEAKALSDIRKELYYYGNVEKEDLVDVLTEEGDFCVRQYGEQFGVKPMLQLAVLHKKEVVIVPIKFFDQNGKHMVKLTNAYFNGVSIADLLLHHIGEKKPVNEHSALLIRAISRPLWQIKQENIFYEIKIGQGAFGEVWQAFLMPSNPLKRPIAVAIKVKKMENLDKIEEILNEARLMRGLYHPNVVRFFGVVREALQKSFFQHSFVAIVMELVKGGSLLKFLQNRPTLTEIERMKFCMDIAGGVAYLHSVPIIHRDIAARNCLIAIEKRMLKISDFGMSHKCEKYSIKSTELTSIRWQAPEVMIKSHYTKASDVWSLGIVFWEIYNNGKVPYEKYTNNDIRRNIGDSKFRLEKPKGICELMSEIFESVW